MSISDTSTEAKKVICELYQRMSPAKKIELVFDAYRAGRILSMAGIRMQYPSASDDEIWNIWARRHLGEQLYKKVYGSRKE